MKIFWITAGYVLSKEALKRFVEEALPDKKLCREDGHGAEDAEMGMLLYFFDPVKSSFDP
jgi:hypothetical protein